MLLRDEWAEVALWIGSRSNGELVEALGDFLNQRIGHVTHRNHNADCHTAFTRRAEGRVDCPIGRDIEIGVG